MDHEEVRERLSDYIEGALSAEEEAAVEAHLASCAECRAEYEELKETLSLLSSLTPVRAPDGFAASVRHKMRRRGRRMRRTAVSHGLRQKVPYETIALIMLLIILAIYLMLFIFRSEDVEFLPSRPQGARPSPSRPALPKQAPEGKTGARSPATAPDRRGSKKSWSSPRFQGPRGRNPAARGRVPPR